MELTSREQEILKMICDGLGSKQIAHRLQISEIAVQRARTLISDKLNIRSIALLTRYAIRIGLVQP